MNHAIPKSFRGYKFYDPTLKIIFQMRITQFFEDVEFGGRNKFRDITFEEESISISEPILTITFDNIQVPIPIVVQEANSKPQQDDVEQTSTKLVAIIPKNNLNNQCHCDSLLEKG